MRCLGALIAAILSLLLVFVVVAVLASNGARDETAAVVTTISFFAGEYRCSRSRSSIARSAARQTSDSERAIGKTPAARDLAADSAEGADDRGRRGGPVADGDLARDRRRQADDPGRRERCVGDGLRSAFPSGEGRAVGAEADHEGCARAQLARLRAEDPERREGRTSPSRWEIAGVYRSGPWENELEDQVRAAQEAALTRDRERMGLTP